MEPEENLETRKTRSPSTSYADIAFGRSSPCPTTADQSSVSSLQGYSSPDRRAEAPSDKLDSRASTLCLNPDGSTRSGIHQELKTPEQRRSLRDQRQGPSKYKSRKPYSLRHSSASPCAPRNNFGLNTMSGASPPPRPVSALSALPVIDSVLRLESGATGPEMSRSSSPMWSRDGKSPSYAQIFFGKPSADISTHQPVEHTGFVEEVHVPMQTGITDSEENVPSQSQMHKVEPSKYPATEVPPPVASPSESRCNIVPLTVSDVFADISQFQAEDSARIEDPKASEKPKSLPTKTTASYSNILSLGLTEQTREVRPVTPKIDVPEKLSFSQVQIRSTSPEITRKPVEPDVIQHPTIPGLALKKEEARLLAPSSNSRRRRKSRKHSGEKPLITGADETPPVSDFNAASIAPVALQKPASLRSKCSGASSVQKSDLSSGFHMKPVNTVEECAFASTISSNVDKKHDFCEILQTKSEPEITDSSPPGLLKSVAKSQIADLSEPLIPEKTVVKKVQGKPKPEVTRKNQVETRLSETDTRESVASRKKAKGKRRARAPELESHSVPSETEPGVTDTCQTHAKPILLPIESMSQAVDSDSEISLVVEPIVEPVEEQLGKSRDSQELIAAISESADTNTGIEVPMIESGEFVHPSAEEASLESSLLEICENRGNAAANLAEVGAIASQYSSLMMVMPTYDVAERVFQEYRSIKNRVESTVTAFQRRESTNSQPLEMETAQPNKDGDLHELKMNRRSQETASHRDNANFSSNEEICIPKESLSVIAHSSDEFQQATNTATKTDEVEAKITNDPVVLCLAPNKLENAIESETIPAVPAFEPRQQQQTEKYDTADITTALLLKTEAACSKAVSSLPTEILESVHNPNPSNVQDDRRSESEETEETYVLPLSRKERKKQEKDKKREKGSRGGRGQSKSPVPPEHPSHRENPKKTRQTQRKRNSSNESTTLPTQSSVVISSRVSHDLEPEITGLMEENDFPGTSEPMISSLVEPIPETEVTKPAFHLKVDEFSDAWMDVLEDGFTLSDEDENAVIQNTPEFPSLGNKLESEIGTLIKEEPGSTTIESISSTSIPVELQVEAEIGNSSFHLKVDEFSDAWMDVLKDGFTISDDEENDPNNDAMQNKQTLFENQHQKELIPPTPDNSFRDSTLDTPSTGLVSQGQPELDLTTNEPDDLMNILDDAWLIISDEGDVLNDVSYQAEAIEADEPVPTLVSPVMQEVLTMTVQHGVKSNSSDAPSAHVDDSQLMPSLTDLSQTTPSDCIAETGVVSTITLSIGEDEEGENKQFSCESSILLDLKTPQIQDKVSYVNAMKYITADSAFHEHQHYPTYLAQTNQSNNVDGSVVNMCLEASTTPDATKTNMALDTASNLFPNLPLVPEAASICLATSTKNDNSTGKGAEDSVLRKSDTHARQDQMPQMSQRTKSHQNLRAASFEKIDLATTELKAALDTDDASKLKRSPVPFLEAISQVVQEVQTLGELLPIPSGIVKDAIKCFEAIGDKTNLGYLEKKKSEHNCAAAGRIDDGSRNLVLHVNEFVDSCQDQVLVQQDAERVWHEKLARDNKQSREKKGKLGSGQDERKPPPDSDPFNRKRHPGSGGKDDDGRGGCGSGGSGRPVSHILYSGPSQLSSEWLDISTKLPTSIYSYNFGTSGLDENLGDNTSIWGPWTWQSIVHRKYDIFPDTFTVIGEPCDSALQGHFFQAIKHSTRTDLQNLEELLKSAAHKISTLNTEAVEETLQQTDELLRILSDLETSFHALKEVISTFPQHDAEVKDLGHQTGDLVYQTRALLSCTGKLNKCAKDRISLIQAENFSPANEELIIPVSSELLKSVVSEPLKEESQESEAMEGKGAVTPPVSDTDRPTSGKISVTSSIQDAEGDDGVISSIDVATIVLPKVESHAQMQDGSGGAFVAKIERSGFISNTREISMVQSFKDGVPVDSNSSVHYSGTHFEGEKESHYSESDSEPARVSEYSSLVTTTGGDPNSAIFTNVSRSASPTPSASLASGFSESLLGQLVPQQGDESMTIRVRQVSQHVTRRIIRKRRRIIRKVTVINGVETVTEEVIEEPDEVDEHTSEFSSGPVTDIAGRISPYHSRRPVSPGVVISEIHDPDTTTREGSNVPITQSGVPHSPQRFPSRSTSPSNFQTSRFSKDGSDELHRIVHSGELPVSVSECSMKISVKPIGQSDTPSDEALQMPTVQIPEMPSAIDVTQSTDPSLPKAHKPNTVLKDAITPSVVSESSNLDSTGFTEIDRSSLPPDKLMAVQNQRTKKLKQHKFSQKPDVYPEAQIGIGKHEDTGSGDAKITVASTAALTSDTSSNISVDSTVDTPISQKGQKPVSAIGIPYESTKPPKMSVENKEATEVPSLHSSSDKPAEEISSELNIQFLEPVHSIPETSEKIDQLCGNQKTDTVDIENSSAQTLGEHVGEVLPEIIPAMTTEEDPEKPTRSQEARSGKKKRAGKNKQVVPPHESTEMVAPVDSKEIPVSQSGPSQHDVLKASPIHEQIGVGVSSPDIAAQEKHQLDTTDSLAESESTRIEVEDGVQAAHRPPDADDSLSFKKDATTIDQLSSASHLPEIQGIHPGQEIIKSDFVGAVSLDDAPTIPPRRRQPKSPSPHKSFTVDATGQHPEVPPRRRQSKSPSPAPSRSSQEELAQTPRPPLRRRQSKSPSPVQSRTKPQTSEQVPTAPVRRIQSKSPSPGTVDRAAIESPVLVSVSEETPKVPPRRRVSKSPSSATDKPGHELSLGSDSQPHALNQPKPGKVERKKKRKDKKKHQLVPGESTEENLPTEQETPFEELTEAEVKYGESEHAQISKAPEIKATIPVTLPSTDSESTTSRLGISNIVKPGIDIPEPTLEAAEASEISPDVSDSKSPETKLETAGNERAFQSSEDVPTDATFVPFKNQLDYTQPNSEITSEVIPPSDIQPELAAGTTPMGQVAESISAYTRPQTTQPHPLAVKQEIKYTETESLKRTSDPRNLKPDDSDSKAELFSDANPARSSKIDEPQTLYLTSEDVRESLQPNEDISGTKNQKLIAAKSEPVDEMKHSQATSDADKLKPKDDRSILILDSSAEVDQWKHREDVANRTVDPIQSDENIPETIHKKTGNTEPKPQEDVQSNEPSFTLPEQEELSASTDKLIVSKEPGEISVIPADGSIEFSKGISAASAPRPKEQKSLPDAIRLGEDFLAASTTKSAGIESEQVDNTIQPSKDNSQCHVTILPDIKLLPVGPESKPIPHVDQSNLEEASGSEPIYGTIESNAGISDRVEVKPALGKPEEISASTNISITRPIDCISEFDQPKLGNSEQTLDSSNLVAGYSSTSCEPEFSDAPQKPSDENAFQLIPAVSEDRDLKEATSKAAPIGDEIHLVEAISKAAKTDWGQVEPNQADSTSQDQSSETVFKVTETSPGDDSSHQSCDLLPQSSAEDTSGVPEPTQDEVKPEQRISDPSRTKLREDIVDEHKQSGTQSEPVEYEADPSGDTFQVLEPRSAEDNPDPDSIGHKNIFLPLSKKDEPLDHAIQLSEEDSGFLPKEHILKPDLTEVSGISKTMESKSVDLGEDSMGNFIGLKPEVNVAEPTPSCFAPEQSSAVAQESKNISEETESMARELLTEPKVETTAAQVEFCEEISKKPALSDIKSESMTYVPQDDEAISELTEAVYEIKPRRLDDKYKLPTIESVLSKAESKSEDSKLDSAAIKLQPIPSISEAAVDGTVGAIGEPSDNVTKSIAAHSEGAKPEDVKERRTPFGDTSGAKPGDAKSESMEDKIRTSENVSDQAETITGDILDEPIRDSTDNKPTEVIPKTKVSGLKPKCVDQEAFSQFEDQPIAAISGVLHLEPVDDTAALPDTTQLSEDISTPYFKPGDIEPQSIDEALSKATLPTLKKEKSSSRPGIIKPSKDILEPVETKKSDIISKSNTDVSESGIAISEVAKPMPDNQAETIRDDSVAKFIEGIVAQATSSDALERIGKSLHTDEPVIKSGGVPISEVAKPMPDHQPEAIRGENATELIAGLVAQAKPTDVFERIDKAFHPEEPVSETEGLAISEVAKPTLKSQAEVIRGESTTEFLGEKVSQPKPSNVFERIDERVCLDEPVSEIEGLAISAVAKPKAENEAETIRDESATELIPNIIPQTKPSDVLERSIESVQLEKPVSETGGLVISEFSKATPENIPKESRDGSATKFIGDIGAKAPSSDALDRIDESVNTAKPVIKTEGVPTSEVAIPMPENQAEAIRDENVTELKGGIVAQAKLSDVFERIDEPFHLEEPVSQNDGLAMPEVAKSTPGKQANATRDENTTELVEDIVSQAKPNDAFERIDESAQLDEPVSKTEGLASSGVATPMLTPENQAKAIRDESDLIAVIVGEAKSNDVFERIDEPFHLNEPVSQNDGLAISEVSKSTPEKQADATRDESSTELIGGIVSQGKPNDVLGRIDESTQLDEPVFKTEGLASSEVAKPKPTPENQAEGIGNVSDLKAVIVGETKSNDVYERIDELFHLEEPVSQNDGLAISAVAKSTPEKPADAARDESATELIQGIVTQAKPNDVFVRIHESGQLDELVSKTEELAISEVAKPKPKPENRVEISPDESELIAGIVAQPKPSDGFDEPFHPDEPLFEPDGLAISEIDRPAPENQADVIREETTTEFLGGVVAQAKPSDVFEQISEAVHLNEPVSATENPAISELVKPTLGIEAEAIGGESATVLIGGKAAQLKPSDIFERIDEPFHPGKPVFETEVLAISEIAKPTPKNQAQAIRDEGATELVSGKFAQAKPSDVFERIDQSVPLNNPVSQTEGLAISEAATPTLENQTKGITDERATELIGGIVIQAKPSDVFEQIDESVHKGEPVSEIEKLAISELGKVTLDNEAAAIRDASATELIGGILAQDKSTDVCELTVGSADLNEPISETAKSKLDKPKSESIKDSSQLSESRFEEVSAQPDKAMISKPVDNVAKRDETISNIVKPESSLEDSISVTAVLEPAKIKLDPILLSKSTDNRPETIIESTTTKSSDIVPAPAGSVAESQLFEDKIKPEDISEGTKSKPGVVKDESFDNSTFSSTRLAQLTEAEPGYLKSDTVVPAMQSRALFPEVTEPKPTDINLEPIDDVTRSTKATSKVAKSKPGDSARVPTVAASSITGEGKISEPSSSNVKVEGDDAALKAEYISKDVEPMPDNSKITGDEAGASPDKFEYTTLKPYSTESETMGEAFQVGENTASQVSLPKPDDITLESGIEPASADGSVQSISEVSKAAPRDIEPEQVLDIVAAHGSVPIVDTFKPENAESKAGSIQSSVSLSQSQAKGKSDTFSSVGKPEPRGPASDLQTPDKPEANTPEQVLPDDLKETQHGPVVLKPQRSEDTLTGRTDRAEDGIQNIEVDESRNMTAPNDIPRREEDSPNLVTDGNRRNSKSKKSRRKVTFKDSGPAHAVHEVQADEGEGSPKTTVDDGSAERLDPNSDTSEGIIEDSSLAKLKEKPRGVSKIKRKSSSVEAIPGPPVSESIDNLENDVSNLAVSLTREDYTIVLDELTTIEEMVIITIQSIQYEVLKLQRMPQSESHGNLSDLEKQLARLTTVLEQIEVLSKSSELKDEVREALADILKNNSSELTRLTNELAVQKAVDNACKNNLASLITDLSAENTELRSLTQQVLINGEDTSLPAETQLSRLDSIDEQYQFSKQNSALKASERYQFVSDYPSSELLQALEDVNTQSVATEDLISSERNRILQIINMSEEYQQTLEEFAQVIRVAESLLNVRPVAKNLTQLKDQILTHRRFFGNLKRCQKALEKLELDLDAPTKEAHHELHHKLYQQASDILERASRKRQQLTVAASRFARLQDGLKEESQWLDSLAAKIPSLETLKSTTCEHYCSMFQGLYADIIIHQGRIMQLRSVRDGLAEIVDCPDLDSQVDAVMENLQVSCNRIAYGLQSLVGFRDAYTTYDKMITRLKNWLHKVESKMDLISLQPRNHQLDFWELKAQLESQQLLREEAIVLLNQAMALLPVRDEETIWANFQNFDDRWNNLQKAVSETELENYDDEDGTTNSVDSILNSVDKEVQEIQAMLRNTSVCVESEEDLYSYLETLQILKAQILNQQYRVNTISPNDTTVDPAEAEKMGALLRVLSGMDMLVSEELESAHVVREKFSTFARMASKTRRFQDTIRARVGQWTSFFELSQDILKQAFQNCQGIDDDLAQNNVNLEKMTRILSSFPSTSHLSISTAKLESEFHEMEAVSHALTLQVDDLRQRVKVHLKFWQDYNSVSNNVAQLISHHSSTLELLVNEPPETLSSLHLSQRYIQALQNATRDNRCIEDLESIISGRIKSECPEVLKAEILTACEALLADWKEVELQTSALQNSYIRGQEPWSKIVPLKNEINEWTNTLCPQVELGKPNRLIKDKLKNLPTYEDKMNELQALATELCVTLAPTQKNKASTPFLITSEVEGLSKKLELLRAYWTSMQLDSSPDTLQEAKQALTSTSQDIRADIGVEPTADRLNDVHLQLLHLGNAEGRMRAAQQSTSTAPDVEFMELLETSQSLFQQTFVEYLKIWAIISEKEDLNELLHLWKNYLSQVEAYLSEAIPVTREQLLEDSSLCTVHQSILSGQYQSLASAMERKPSDFESLQNLYTQIESQLCGRQAEIQERLGSWKIFRDSQERLSFWLRHMEREKRELELNFLQLKRLEPTKVKIEALISRCAGGEKLMEELKRNKTALMPFCNSTIKSSLAQDLSSNMSRYNNLQAALKTWLDHVNRLAGLNESFQSKGNELGMLVANIWDQFNDLRIPKTFSELRSNIQNLRELQQQASVFSPGLEEMQSTLDEMQAAISPADARVLSQKIWSLSQQHIDLVNALAQTLSTAEDKLDLIPAFDSKCKRWLVWADGMREKLERPHCHSLEEYLEWICRDAMPEIKSKLSTYKWLQATVDQLADMTTGREKKEFVKVSKEIKVKWDSLNEAVERRKAKVNHLIQVTEQLGVRFQESMTKLKPLEIHAASPISENQEFKIDSINDELRIHDMHQRKLNNESSEINHVLNLGEVAASDCDELRMYQDATSTRTSLEELHNTWNGLIARFQLKYKLLNQLKDNWRKIADNCDYLETLLAQVETDIEEIEGSDSDISETAIAEPLMAKTKSLLESLRCLTPKVEDLANDYSFVTKQMNTSSNDELGGRVKSVINNWRSLNKRCQFIIENQGRALQFAKFCSAYEAAEGFLVNMNEKVEALHLEKSYAPEEKIQILKDLKAECKRQKGLELAMMETGKASSESELSLRLPIKENIDAYSSMKHNLEKLFNKVMKTSHQELETRSQAQSQIEAKPDPIPVEDVAVQVSTLPLAHASQILHPDNARKPNTEESQIGVPDVSISEAEVEMELPALTRMDIYKNELDRAIQDSEENIKTLESILCAGGKAKPTHESVVKTLATAQKSVDMMLHLHDLLKQEHGASNEFARVKKVKLLVKKLKDKEEQAREYGQTLRESSPAKKVVCPVCSPKQRGVWDSTLWRLEQWLQHAEGTLKETMRKRPPTNLEQLEDFILNHRELLLDLDSHRSLVHALTNVLSHLNEHGATETIGELELERLKERLSKTLEWWNKVCHNAASWQARLQIALLENSDFHQTIEEYDAFISSIQESISELEPVDVSGPRSSIVPKLHAFKQLSEKLVRIEPELRTLLQTAEQLFVNAQAIEKEGTLAPQTSEDASASIFTTPECSLVLERIASLNHDLGTSLRVTEAYVSHLTNVVQQDNIASADASPLMFSVSDRMLDLGSSSPARSSTPLPSTSNDKELQTLPEYICQKPFQSILVQPCYDNACEQTEEGRRSVIATGGRYAYRAFRASLPIQALILLLLGAATLLPYSEQDFSCFNANNFARSLEPMLHWNGPPRI